MNINQRPVFFFQAEDGIRDYKVTGVQTCALPISSFPSTDTFPRTIPRCGRSEGRTSSPWNTTTRFLARVRTASSCICSIGRTSAVCATLILRWSILRPSCAIRADSMFRTTCFACWSLLVSTWISLTSPSGVTTTRADSTPVRLVIRFSARFTPQGSGAWGGGGASGRASRFPVPSVLETVTLALSRRHLVSPRSLGAVQRAVGRHQDVFRLRASARHELRHPNAYRHQPLGVAETPARGFDGGPHFVRHPQRPIHPGAYQHQHEFVAPVARRQVGRADVRPALPRRTAQHL